MSSTSEAITNENEDPEEEDSPSTNKTKKRRIEEEGEQDETSGDGAAVVSQAFETLLARHLVTSLYKQALFSKHIARGRNWKISLDKTQPHYGQLGFGNNDDEETTDYFACQILGSESFVSDTWLWSNVNDSIPSDMTVLASQLRKEYAAVVGIPEFAQDQISLSRLVQGHQLAMIAIGLLDLPAYYSGPNGTVGRTLFLIIELQNENYLDKVDVGELVLAVGKAAELDWFPLSPDRIETFLVDHGATKQQGSAKSQEGADGEGKDLYYDFDDTKTTDNTPPGRNQVIVSLDEDGDVTNIRTSDSD